MVIPDGALSERAVAVVRVLQDNPGIVYAQAQKELKKVGLSVSMGYFSYLKSRWTNRNPDFMRRLSRAQVVDTATPTLERMLILRTLTAQQFLQQCGDLALATKILSTVASVTGVDSTAANGHACGTSGDCRAPNGRFAPPPVQEAVAVA